MTTAYDDGELGWSALPQDYHGEVVTPLELATLDDETLISLILARNGGGTVGQGFTTLNVIRGGSAENVGW